MDALLSNLIKLQNMLEHVLNAGPSSNLKLTKSGKPRIASDRKGKTTARSDFGKMICKENAAEYEAFKATLVSKRAAHITFASNYKEKHPDVYAAFEAKWRVENAVQAEKAVPAIATVPAMPAPTVSAPTVSAPTVSAPTVSTTSPVTEMITHIEKKVVKKPVKTAKKAITTEVVAPIQGSVADELLPFTIGDKTYLRLGTRRENGNHLWTSGHLWMSKKGAKGGHYGELREDGTINMDADEPGC